MNNYSSMQSMPRLNGHQKLDNSYLTHRRGQSTGLSKIPPNYSDQDIIEYLI